MWKAYLENINENQGPDDVVGVNVKFEDVDAGKSITKGYQLHAGNFKTVQDVKDLVTQELEKLNKFDAVVDLIKSFVGKEIK